MKRLFLLFSRALTLRCPHCGHSGVFASWFHMKPRCPTCGLVFERHEGHDYYLGGMMFNIVISELVYAGLMVGWLVLTWPHPPWTLLEWIGVPFMALAPVMFYPVSKTVWLAFDLMFRPERPEDFEPGVIP